MILFLACIVLPRMRGDERVGVLDNQYIRYVMCRFGVASRKKRLNEKAAVVTFWQDVTRQWSGRRFPPQTPACSFRGLSHSGLSSRRSLSLSAIPHALAVVHTSHLISSPSQVSGKNRLEVQSQDVNRAQTIAHRAAKKLTVYSPRKIPHTGPKWHAGGVDHTRDSRSQQEHRGTASSKQQNCGGRAPAIHSRKPC